MAIITHKNKKADYEVIGDLELINPETEEGTGIIVGVRSDLCQEAKDVQKKLAAAAIAFKVRCENGSEDDAAYAWLNKQNELQIERLRSCVAYIHWNGEEWEEGGGPLPDTKEGFDTFVSVEWIALQIAVKIQEMTAFTKA